MEVIRKRSIVCGVIPTVAPEWWDRYPYSSKTQFDVRMMLADGDARAQGTLDFYYQLFCGKKLEKEKLFEVVPQIIVKNKDCGDVAKEEYYNLTKDGEIIGYKIKLASPKEILARCSADVLATKEIFEKMKGYYW